VWALLTFIGGSGFLLEGLSSYLEVELLPFGNTNEILALLGAAAGDMGMDVLKDLLMDANKKITGTSGIEKEFKSFINETLSATGVKTNAAAEAVKQKAQPKPLSESNILGEKLESKTKQTEKKQPSQINTKTDVTGNIKITIDGTVGANGLTQQQLNAIFNSDGFKQYIAGLGKDAKGSGVISYQ
jgi:hypothetical protein